MIENISDIKVQKEILNQVNIEFLLCKELFVSPIINRSLCAKINSSISVIFQGIDVQSVSKLQAQKQCIRL